MGYDILGNQVLLNDPDAGSTLYTYNAFGDLESQTDWNQNEYLFTYDKLGRVLTRDDQVSDLTSYIYDTKPNGLGMVSSVTCSNGIVSDYSYDEYSRLSAISENIDGTNYVSAYQHNNYNQMVQETYPSGLVVKNHFDGNGFLDEIRDAANAILWEAGASNEFRNLTSYTLGDNKLNCSKAYDALGFLTDISAKDASQAYVQNLGYDFSHSRGNLNWRKDYTQTPTLEENFGYDLTAETCLKSSQVGSSDAFTTLYDNNGNISFKTDAGTFSYTHPTKPHAVTGITGNPCTIPSCPSCNQHIDYTPFNKVSSITEDGKQLLFTYGQDRLRRKTQLYDNFVLQQTKYFLGYYEKVIDETTGTEKEYHYLSAPSGLFAVITKTDGGAGVLNYILTDHLGSIQTVTDDDGIVESTHSYDPWGRLRNATDWTFTNPCDLPFFGRGYTGHEHLLEFGLINMNGRLYDPVLGRMLSPDNFVQNAGNSQTFNRYTYAHNNPLVYTDPDGNNPFFLLMAGMMLWGGGQVLQGEAQAGRINENWGTVGGVMKVGGIAMMSSAMPVMVGGVPNPLLVGTKGFGFTILNGGSESQALRNGAFAGISAFSAYIDIKLGNFTGIEGSGFDNAMAELGHSTLKGGARGLAAGGIAYALTKDESYLWKGAGYGMAIGGGLAALRIATMGPAWIPGAEYGELENFGQVYRKGPWGWPEGNGMTIGRNVIYKLYGDLDWDRSQLFHETGHISDINSMGWFKFYARTTKEYGRSMIKNGFLNWKVEVYGLDKFGSILTLENRADYYSFQKLGYWMPNPGVYKTTWP